MQEYVVSLRRGADLKLVAESGSLMDALRETPVRIMEVLPTGKTIIVAVSNASELKLLHDRLGPTCHVVERTVGHFL